MNSERFDPIIAQIAREEGTLEKQLWREDRRRSHAYLRRVRTAYDLEEEEEEEDADAAGSRAHDDAEGSVDVDQGEFQYMELDLDGVEIDSVTGKRKRRPSNSTPLSLSRKKPRFEEHSSPVPNARSKGKQRASDQFEQVDSDQPEFGYVHLVKQSGMQRLTFSSATTTTNTNQLHSMMISNLWDQARYFNILLSERSSETFLEPIKSLS